MFLFGSYLEQYIVDKSAEFEWNYSSSGKLSLGICIFYIDYVIL